ncbi:MAG: 1,4-dihydroxy-2-naphthoate octaprenyltransferase [Dehalococcoidales bacterium]|nr:1,4-dihydroxy-2-naphthoate octaprenyltransferase [Dehalococcoidales bacterium]
MSEQHSREEILALMEKVEVAAVATSAGDSARIRMMHHAADEDFNIYLATMKGDPKTVQMTHHPSISLLMHQSGADINQAAEVEVTGKALFVRDREEREKALEMTAKRSPVVKYLVETGNSGMLDCVKVMPVTVKFRIFNEIVQGMPPTVLEFPQNRQVVSDWHLIKMKVKSWVMALRVPFLTASAVPVLLGTSIAWFTTGTLYWGFFLLTLLAGVLVHIGANVINDYFDYRSGNDEVNREFVRPFSGGSRVIQLGFLSPVEVLSGSLVFFLVSALIGFYLAWARGPFILLLGAIGLLSAMFYTGGLLNWAKRGYGELLVGLNFGVLMTLGAYFVQTQSFSWVPVVAAVPVSLLIAAVLYINEFPDYAADKQVGKNTLVVRLGRVKAVGFYTLIMAGVYLSIVVGVAAGILPLPALLGLVTLPLAVRAVQYARKHHSSSFDLVPANALTVTSHLTTGLLLTLGFVWSMLGAQGFLYVAIIGVTFVGFAIFMYRYIERQKNIFFGLKKAVG